MVYVLVASYKNEPEFELNAESFPHRFAGEVRQFEHIGRRGIPVIDDAVGNGFRE
jgi:hypothetical protein